jgi:hypothetical protein
MKMDFEEFRSVADSGPELPASDLETGDEPDDRDADEKTGSVRTAKPTMSVDMGPDGTNVSVDAPLNDMEPQEAINLAQEVQGPSMGEELKDVLLDPTVQEILTDMWYGPDEQAATGGRAHAETTTMNPTDQLDTDDGPTAETDGGQKLDDANIYRITPEGLVAILQQQAAEVAALKPDMTLDELSGFMAEHEERLVGEAEELLEALDDE